MKILILSDAHIGLGDKEYNEKLVSKILEESKKYDYVIFNGDMIETWKYSEYGWDSKTRADKAKEIFNDFPSLYEFINDEKCIFLIGNHDISLEEFGFFKRTCDIETKTKRIRVVHGNDCSKETSYDYIKSKNSYWVIMGAWLSSKVSEFLSIFGYDIKDSERVFNNSLDFFKGINFTYNTKDNEMEKYIKKLANKNKFTDYIVGHTHERELNTKVSHVKLHNTGKCSLTSLEGIVINTDKDEITFREET